MKKLRVALVSTWLPRESGISTFGADFARFVQAADANISFSVFAVDERSRPRKYGKEVVGVLRPDERGSYERIAQAINAGGYDAVVIQHEYAIYGPSPDGRDIVRLLKALRVPSVTVLHTVALVPRSRRRTKRLPLLKRIVEASDQAIVTGWLTKRELVRDHGFPGQKLAVVHHGSPEFERLAASQRQALRSWLGYRPDQTVLLSFGLIRPGKGLEYALQAMERVSRRQDVKLVIAGRPGPGRAVNKTYYERLRRQSRKPALAGKVEFVDRFLTDGELHRLCAASDLMLTPYTRLEQASSGVLGWAMASGLAVVSTPYAYAREVLGQGRGVLVPARDTDKLVTAIEGLIRNPARRKRIVRAAAAFSRKTSWSNAGRAYAKLIRTAARVGRQ